MGPPFFFVNPMLEVVLAVLGILWGVLCTVVGMVAKNLYSRLHNMDERLNGLHETYAKKEDVNRDFTFIQESLKRIEDKLDKKVDK